MGGNCQLAMLDENGAHAYWLGTGVLITARGTVPESCWRATIRPSLPPIEHAPEFLVERCRTADICLPVVTDYSAAREFELGTEPKHIVLHHDGGRTEVPVEPIPTALESIITEAATAADLEATGISFAFSFEDALDSALSKLAGEPSNIPVDVTVESIKAGRGGIIPPYIAVTVKKA
jgi:hypothetical protein